MARCDWCGKTDKKVVELPNGRTVLRLCSFCKAEYDLKQGGPIVLPSTGVPEPSWWERVKKFFS